MPREKPKRWSVRFELAPEDPEDVKIYTFLSGLAKRQAASTWLRDTIRAAIEHEMAPAAITWKVNAGEATTARLTPLPPLITSVLADDDVTYVDPEETA